MAGNVLNFVKHFRKDIIFKDDILTSVVKIDRGPLFFFNSHRKKIRPLDKTDSFKITDVIFLLQKYLFFRDFWRKSREIEDQLFQLCENMAPPPLLAHHKVKQ